MAPYTYQSKYTPSWQHDDRNGKENSDMVSINSLFETLSLSVSLRCVQDVVPVLVDYCLLLQRP